MEVDDLYTVPPEEFVAARNALVKQLKAAGQKAEAAVVAKLKRPSAVAWALNQVARSDPGLVTVAIDAAQALRRASDAAVAGDPDQLRAATAAERTAANAIVKAVAPHLGTRAASAQPAILATLRVAGLDEAVADELRRGLLSTEHEQPGFGFGFGVDDSPVVSRPTKRPKLRAVPDLEPEVDEAAIDAAKAERAAAKEAERQRKKERLARQRTADRLTKEATRLAKEADEAEAAAAEARQTAEDARARADAAVEAVAEVD
jgi:hypothetical protein